MVRISEEYEEFLQKIFPHLQENLKRAQMEPDITSFVTKSFLFSVIFSFNYCIIFFFILLKIGGLIFLLPLFLGFLILNLSLCASLPKLNIKKVRREIESDIFVPSRTLLTLLESGNSLISALEGASYTKAKSSKYFGKIASEIYLGKNIDQAIGDAIHYTPSESFRRILQPIRVSLKTGTDIQKNLLTVLKDLTEEKIIEIEEYEKKLNPLSMIYMIFGTIVPAIGVVVFVILMSIMGIRVEFFPFLFILLFVLLIIQMLFVNVFRTTRPLVKL